MTETDEKYIAIAMLHARDLQFIQLSNSEEKYAWGCWDQANARDCKSIWSSCSGPTKALAARRYCERHGLLEEVSDE